MTQHLSRLASLSLRHLVVWLTIFGVLWGQQAQAQSLSIIRDSEIEDMLRDWSDPIFEAGGLDPQAVNIYLISDFSMNAFVTGGQNVFFHTGIIVAADQPMELKGVIAHETGHISGGHLARFQDGTRRAMVPMVISLAAGILAAAAGEGGAGAALIASSQQFGMLELFQYTQDQESAADQAAVRYLEATGQSGAGLIRFFERFQEQELWRDPSARDPYFRTHPLSRNRVAALRTPVASQVYGDVRDSAEDVDRLRRVQAKIFGFLASTRRVFTLYPPEDESIYAYYARAVAHHRTGARDLAIEHVDELLRREPENPYFLELKGQIFFENGLPEQAIEPYRAAIALQPESVLFRIGLAQALLAKRDQPIDEAKLREAHDALVFATAPTREPENAFAWMLRSIIYEERSDEPRTQWAVAEARLIGGAYPEAFQRATRALEGLPPGSIEAQRANDIIVKARNEEVVQRALRERGRRR